MVRICSDLTPESSNLPKIIEASVADAIIPGLVSTLVAEWLTPSVPLELSDMPELEVLQTKASGTHSSRSRIAR